MIFWPTHTLILQRRNENGSHVKQRQHEFTRTSAQNTLRTARFTRVGFRARDLLTHTQLTGNTHARPGHKQKLWDADTLTLRSHYSNRSLHLSLSIYMTLNALQRVNDCCVPGVEATSPRPYRLHTDSTYKMWHYDQPKPAFTSRQQLSHKQRPSPVDSGVCPNGCNGGPHVLQIPDLDSAVITARDDVIPDGEHGGGHSATRKARGQSRGPRPSPPRADRST